MLHLCLQPFKRSREIIVSWSNNNDDDDDDDDNYDTINNNKIINYDNKK